MYIAIYLTIAIVCLYIEHCISYIVYIDKCCKAWNIAIHVSKLLGLPNAHVYLLGPIVRQIKDDQLHSLKKLHFA